MSELEDTLREGYVVSIQVELKISEALIKVKDFENARKCFAEYHRLIKENENILGEEKLKEIRKEYGKIMALYYKAKSKRLKK